MQELLTKYHELAVATTQLAELDKRLSESEADVHTLLEMLARSNREHVIVLAKPEVDHDLALRITSNDALQQGKEERQHASRRLVSSVAFSRSWRLPSGNASFRSFSQICWKLTCVYMCSCPG